MIGRVIGLIHSHSSPTPRIFTFSRATSYCLEKTKCILMSGVYASAIRGAGREISRSEGAVEFQSASRFREKQTEGQYYCTASN